MDVWPGRPYPLGATWDGSGVNFALFSEHAEKVELCLFDPKGRRELARIALPFLLCMSLVALYSGVLNALGRFAVAAFAPSLLNVVLIVVLLTLIAANATALTGTTPASVGADYPNRTDDLPLTRRLLYQLS